MSQQRKPSIHLLAETKVESTAVLHMLYQIGMEEKAAIHWVGHNFDIAGKFTDGERLAEVAGRLCYKSFDVELNSNLTKVREGNKDYLANVIKSGHGSVLEHATTTIAFCNVSRVFTHEIVRHRVGCAFSQESLRYVRLDNLGYRMPAIFGDVVFMHQVYEALPMEHKYREKLTFDQFCEQIEGALDEVFAKAFSNAEACVSEVGTILSIDELKNFNVKKAITSAMRRLAPIGLTTNIIVTANHRAWRHMIELRTTKHAEEEVREVIGLVASTFMVRYPHFYQDMSQNEEGEYIFQNSKI